MHNKLDPSLNYCSLGDNFRQEDRNTNHWINMEEPLDVRIRDFNPHIVCSLCAGYFINATTITECLHTFCKSCIVKYLQSNKCCPQCTTKIHETQPFINLKPDRVLQDIVFKIVPGLYESEEKRKQEFYRSRGLATEQKQAEVESRSVSLTSIYDHPEAHYYRHDKLVCLCLETYRPTNDADQLGGFTPPKLPKKFVRCPVRTCVHHLQLLLFKKLHIPSHLQVEILCNETVLDPSFTLKQVWLTHWNGRASPMMLFYRLQPHLFPPVPQSIQRSSTKPTEHLAFKVM